MSFIYESKSPVCDLLAAVDRDENTYYFYLMESPDLRPKIRRPIWLCNRKPAPETLDLSGTGALMMPREFVQHDPNGMELDEKAFRVVWYTNGDCAALFYQNTLLAAIPPYAGVEDFPGFSRYVRGRTRYGWELADEDVSNVLGWLNRANKQWQFILSEDGWQQFDEIYREAYTDFSGEPQHYLRLDVETLPHRRLWMSQRGNTCYSLTAGMAQMEMPGVQQQFGTDYQKYARIELGFACTKEQAEMQKLLTIIMDDMSQLPWKESDFLAHGHTVEAGFSSNAGNSFQRLLLLDAAQVKGLEMPPLPDFFGFPVRLLWLVPISEAEFIYLQERGLQALLRRAFLPEQVHIFDGQPKFLTR